MTKGLCTPEVCPVRILQLPLHFLLTKWENPVDAIATVERIAGVNEPLMESHMRVKYPFVKKALAMYRFGKCERGIKAKQFLKQTWNVKSI